MKIRKGFVSNSSSSSFICDISGGIEAGYDMSLDEAGMVECEKGHTFYTNYLIKKDGWDDYVNSGEYEYGWDIPSKFCPICNFKKVSRKDAYRVLIKMQGLNNLKEVEQMILDKFDSFDELQEYIKDVKL
jgi:hypothetical protein